MKSNEPKSNIYVVFTQKVASYLMTQGFKLKGMHPDRTKPEYNVFLFGDSPEVRQAIQDYKMKG